MPHCERPLYERLKEPGFEADDSELFEVGGVGMSFIEKITDGEPFLGHSSEGERAQQQKNIRDHIYSVPSTEILNSTKVQPSKGYPDNCRVQEQQLQREQQNIENGNPNVRSSDPTTHPNVVAICSHSSTASGSSLQEQQGNGTKGGASVSGRSVGRLQEERSGRCRGGGCDSCHRDNATGILDSDSVNSSVPSPRPFGGQWTPYAPRGTPYREREPVIDRHLQETLSSRAGRQSQHTQPQDKQSCTPHPSSNDGRYCQRCSRESSPQEAPFNDQITVPERKNLSLEVQPRSDASYGGSFIQERNPGFQRSNSGKGPPGLQRSSSTKEAPGHQPEMTIENWRNQSGSRSAHVSDRVKHRVSFSLTENHELETEKMREKWREPTAHSKKVLQAKQETNRQPLRYNYEQPGFVEREKENICSGKAYTIYGVKEVKECPKGSSGRHQQLVRAFSLHENNSSYAKIPRAYSVNAGGRHVMPMECDTCGKGGIGIVFLGIPGNEATFCKSCKSESGWGCSDKPPKKKKSIMAYCRKLLRLPQKTRYGIP